MKEIRVGIIGGGMISHRHMVIYSNIQRRAAELGFTAKVVACAEIDDATRKAWVEKYGMAEKDMYKNYRDMLKRDDLDTIDVCVHNNLHTPISIEVMKAGFDCYCEKPEAVSYRDAQMMIDCAKKLGRKYHVQMSSIMTPQARVGRDMIARGELGNPYFVNLEQCTMRRRPGYDAGLRAFTTDFYSKRISGHGPSIDLGIYVIGQILFMLGCPKLQSVSGFAKQAMELKPKLITNPDGFGVEDICDGFAKFETGLGFHFLSTSANNAKEDIVVALDILPLLVFAKAEIGSDTRNGEVLLTAVETGEAVVLPRHQPSLIVPDGLVGELVVGVEQVGFGGAVVGVFRGDMLERCQRHHLPGSAPDT